MPPTHPSRGGWSARRSRAVHRNRLQVEPLEGRALLATIAPNGGVSGFVSVGSQADHNYVAPGNGLNLDGTTQELAKVNYPGLDLLLGGRGASRVAANLQTDEASQVTTFTLGLTSMGQSFHYDNSEGEVTPPADVDVSTGLSLGGNPGDWVDLTIAPTGDEHDGDPVRVKLVASAASSTHGGVGVDVTGEYRVDLGDGEGEQLLYQLDQPGGDGGQVDLPKKERSVDTTVGKTIRVLMVVNTKGTLTDLSNVESTSAGFFQLSITLTPLPRPDYVAGAVTADPVTDALNYSYELTNADAPAGASPRVTLFWAKGPNESDKLGVAYETAAATKVGKVGPVHVDHGQLAARPDDATHLILMVDSSNAVNEQSETNNLAAVKVPRTDLAPLSLAGDLKKGIDFSYAVSGFPIPASKGTDVALYWASAPSLPFVLGNPVAIQSAGKAIGSYGTFHVAPQALGVPPAGAKMLLLVVDPADKVREESETNNTLSLAANWTIGGGGGGGGTGGAGGPLAWGAKVSPAFRDKVRAVSTRLGIDDPSWLMAAMAFESGGSFSPSVVNRASGAVGLIQFLPSTAKSLKTTTAALARMSPEQQLDYVEKYLSPYRNRMTSVDDLYMAILQPSAIGKPTDAVLFVKPKKPSRTAPYTQNAALDANHDGKITKAEAAKPVRDRLERGQLSGNVEPST